MPHRPSDTNDDNEFSGPDITNKTFEVSMINSSNIYPKTFAQYDHPLKENQWTKEELTLPGYNLVAEQTMDKELFQLKEELQSCKASQAIYSKDILLDNGLYHLSKADSNPVIWLYIPEHLWKEVIEQSKQNTTGQICTKTYINLYFICPVRQET